MQINSIRGLRAARLDRVLDALDGRSTVSDSRPPRPRGERLLPLQALRFLSSP